MDSVNEPTSDAWSRHGAIATSDRLSMDTVDENVLLAETEDILATLDATAFGAASPVVSASSITYYHWGGEVRPATLIASAPGLDHGTTQRVKKKRMQSLEKLKHELAALHRASFNLEAQLASLQQSHSSVVTKKQILSESWQRIAHRQRQLLQRTEAENQKLKTMIFEILNAPEKFAQYSTSADSSSVLALPNLPNYTHGPPKMRISFEQGDARLVETCEMLLNRLDVAYADMDAVFHMNGLNEHVVKHWSFVKYKKLDHGGEDSGTQYVELVNVGVTPFPAALMAKMTWEAMVKWHHKDNAYSHPCTDHPNDTFVVNHHATNSSSTESSSVVLTLAMRRYFMRDRFVFVWAAQSDGEKDLADAFTKETGWLAMSSIPGPEALGPPMTVLQSCMHVFPKSRKEGPVHPKKANALLNYVMSVFEEDVTFIHQMVENAILRMMHSEGAHCGTDFSTNP
ncbi:hypothetical protein FI667_g11917, partial [Globisporangium splendens]